MCWGYPRPYDAASLKEGGYPPTAPNRELSPPALLRVSQRIQRGTWLTRAGVLPAALQPASDAFGAYELRSFE